MKLLFPITLFLMLSTCAGLQNYQATVDSRRVAVGYNGDGTIGFSDKVVYRQSPK